MHGSPCWHSNPKSKCEWDVWRRACFGPSPPTEASSDRGHLPSSENAAVHKNVSRACLPERLKHGRTALQECIAFQILVMMNRTKASTYMLHQVFRACKSMQPHIPVRLVVFPPLFTFEKTEKLSNILHSTWLINCTKFESR